MPRERIVWVDCWISCLMVLVIMGHCSFAFAPAWYPKLHSWLYSFHMGAFFLVAGFLVELVYRPIYSVREYWLYERRKLLKFGVPFVILGVLLSTFSVWSRGEGVADFFNAVFMLFACPTASRVIYLWFIYVLFMFYLAAPLFCQMLKTKPVWSLAIGAVFYCLPLPAWGALHLFSRFLIFFIAGTMVRDFLPVLKKIPRPVIWAITALFIVWSCMGRPELPYLASCCLALPGLQLLSSFLSDHAGRRVVKCCTLVSSNCFSIYLYQMIFLNCLALVWRKLQANSLSFAAFMLVGVAVSFGGAICIAGLLDKGIRLFNRRSAA